MKDDIRWKYGVPPTGNANYAWLQHMLHHLNPSGGVAGTVLANGSLSTQSSGEGEIRRNMINADVVECIVSMPSQLFYSVTIPVSLWIMRRGKNEKTRGKILFIDAQNLGHMIDRRIRELSEDDIQKISSAYHRWRAGEGYEDIVGFCHEATINEISEEEFVLIPGRYVGVAEAKLDDEPYEEKMGRLTSELAQMFERSIQLQTEIKKELQAIGFDM